MAYRKYRRYTKSKQNKRFNKYAYNKTDAKSQSKQIVSLNKKINRIYKNTKPEIQKFNHSESFSLSPDTPKVLAYETFLGKTASTYFKGTYAKNVYFNFKLFFNPGASDLTKGRSFRIIILQSRQETIPDINILQNPEFKIFSPFKDEITRKYKILLSKVYVVSSDKDMFYRSYNFKNLLPYKKTSDGQTFGFIYVMFILSPGQDATTIYYTSKLGVIDY